MCVFGTRPEAIKMAPLILDLQKRQLPVVVVATGQHREMLDQVLKLFHIRPDYDLHIMQPDQTLFDITSNILIKIKQVIEKESPSLILVHGDTSTALVAALAAYYLKIPCGHIEAGLRTYDKFNPFPEEMNRQLIDTLCDYRFCPTKDNRQNLIRENLSKNVYITGNTVIDAVRHISRKPIRFVDKKFQKINFRQKTILLTCHRRESIGQPMINIFNTIKKIVDDFPAVQVVYPVHLNPVVQKTAQSILGRHSRIFLTAPAVYTDMVKLMKKCYLTLTDSGGLQEEVPAFHRPVLVLRNETERQEGITAGTLKLVGTNQKTIYREVRRLLLTPKEYQKYFRAKNPYGDGKSSKNIIDIIEKILSASHAH